MKIPSRNKPLIEIPAPDLAAALSRLLIKRGGNGFVTILKLERVGGYADRSFVFYGQAQINRRNAREVVCFQASKSLGDDSRLRAGLVLGYLWSHGFNRGLYRVTRPIGYDRPSGWLFYHHVQGRVVSSGRLTMDERIHAAELLGGWLAKLHRTTPPTRQYLPSPQINSYWSHLRRVCAVLPTPQKKLINQTIAKILTLENKLSSIHGARLTHFDPHPRNSLLTTSGLTMLDFTESRVFPSFVDLAMAMIQWEKRFVGYHSPSSRLAERRHLLSSYTASSGYRPGDKDRPLWLYAVHRLAIQNIVGDIIRRRSPTKSFKELVLPPPFLYE